MTTRSLIYNARVRTMADDLVVDSMVLESGRIVAIGDGLNRAAAFKRYRPIDLDGLTVVPGFVDAHTHFVFYALSLARAKLYHADSVEGCLKELKRFSRSLSKSEWLVGEGYTPDAFRRRIEPDRWMLDRVTGPRPAFVYSRDQHSAWVNSRALDMAGITARYPDPQGGEIVRQADGTPTGILREKPAIDLVSDLIPPPTRSHHDRRYRKALRHAYRKGVTGVHCFDSWPESFAYLMELAVKGKVGLRMNYYPSADLLPHLHKTRTRYGTGTDFFRIAGVKMFADGALGSQTALCFNKYA